MYKFPQNFFWGAATSSYQVEGNNQNADWWHWEKAAGKENSAGACQHYERYREDFDIAKQLNHNAHRLSIEWSRIEPVEGQFNQQEIQHYIDVIDALQARGIEPMVTLHHFTNPQWLSERGGWTNPQCIGYFTRYAGVMARALASRVRYWMTINEPTIYFSHAFIFGSWPPQAKSYLKAKRVHDHMLSAHITAYRQMNDIYRELNLSKPSIGIAQHISAVETHHPHLINQLRVKIWDYFSNFEILDKLDKAKTMDFIGLNYYSRSLIGPKIPSGITQNSLGWDIYPQGLYDVLTKLKRFNLPVIITENGICTGDDQERWQFISAHLKAMHRAIEGGVPVKGYLYWSLLDNFEWAHGYAPRFGLVDVNYATFERRIRDSARQFAEVCRKNVLD